VNREFHVRRVIEIIIPVDRGFEIRYVIENTAVVDREFSFVVLKILALVEVTNGT